MPINKNGASGHILSRIHVPPTNLGPLDLAPLPSLTKASTSVPKGLLPPLWVGHTSIFLIAWTASGAWAIFWHSAPLLFWCLLLHHLWWHFSEGYPMFSMRCWTEPSWNSYFLFPPFPWSIWPYWCSLRPNYSCPWLLLKLVLVWLLQSSSNAHHTSALFPPVILCTWKCCFSSVDLSHFWSDTDAYGRSAYGVIPGKCEDWELGCWGVWTALLSQLIPASCCACLGTESSYSRHRGAPSLLIFIIIRQGSNVWSAYD